MTSRPHSRREARLLLAIWLLLLALTTGSFWIADLRVAPGAATAGLVLAIATLKAHLVAGVFMEMLRGPRAWAAVMSGFLVAQAALLVALFSA